MADYLAGAPLSNCSYDDERRRAREKELSQLAKESRSLSAKVIKENGVWVEWQIQYNKVTMLFVSSPCVLPSHISPYAKEILASQGVRLSARRGNINEITIYSGKMDDKFDFSDFTYGEWFEANYPEQFYQWLELYTA